MKSGGHHFKKKLRALTLKRVYDILTKKRKRR